MAALTRRLGVQLTSFADHRRVDVAIDGADQVARGTLDLVKGLGGALLREKLVASASDRMIVAVDETKLVDRLGGNTPLPVEIVSFGWQTRARSAGGDRLRAAAALGRRQIFHGGRRQPHR
jgi:ribose 5-phosphate isomerase A